MSNIEKNLNLILAAVYGEEVRTAIHDAIHDCYEDGKAGVLDLIAREQAAQAVETSNKASTVATNAGASANTALNNSTAAVSTANTVNERVNNIIAQSGTSDTEVVDARTDIDGTVYSTLKKRLDVENGLFRNWIEYPFIMYAGKYASKSTGKLTDFPSGPYSGSSLIPILCNKLQVKCACSTDDAGYAFLDSELNLVSSGNCYVSNSAPGIIEIDVPKNARYFRFSTYTAFARQTLFVKGSFNRADSNYYEFIPWLKNYAYTLVNDCSAVPVNNALASDMLFLHEAESLLNGYKYDNGYYYMTLYDRWGYALGSKRPTGYYDTSGNLVNEFDYYSFAITLSAPYTLFATQEIYFAQPVKKHIRIDVTSVQQLESALLKAADLATPYRIYDIYIAPGTYNLWDGLNFNNISGTGDDAYKRGLELVSYCNLYGIGNVVLDLTIPSSGRQYSTVISCLNAHGSESIIKNITLSTYDGRYCVHDDSYPNMTSNHTIIWENCIFEYRGRPDSSYTAAGHCYGAGYFSGFKCVFKNCIFRGGNEHVKWVGVAVHTHGEQLDPFYCEIDSCAFTGTGKIVMLHSAHELPCIPYEARIVNIYSKNGNKAHFKGNYGTPKVFMEIPSSIEIEEDVPGSTEIFSLS